MHLSRPSSVPSLPSFTAGLILAACCAPSVPADATERPSIDVVLDSLERVRDLHEVALSPDGRLVAWAERLHEAGAEGGLGRLQVADVAEGRAWPVSAGPAGPYRERGPAFSPDGRTLAFLSDAGHAGQLQVYAVPATGGEPRALTQVAGQLATPRFSPDGKQLAFLFTAGSKQEPGALVAHARDAGVVEDELETQRIAVVDLASGHVREVSPPGLYVYDYDWSPDGRRFAAEAVYGSGTNDYWTAELYLVDAASGEARSLWKPPLQIAAPRFSKDGRFVACLHGLMSDEGADGGDVYVVPAAGGPARNLTPGFAATPRGLAFRASGRIVFSAHVDGGSGVGHVSPDGGAPVLDWTGPEALTAFDAAAQGEATAVVRQSFRQAAEVWAGAPGAWTQVSKVNVEARPWWGEARSLHWKSDDFEVQGWLLFPLDFDPARRYPLAVIVHGGPSGAHAAGWPARWAGVLPSRGYFVLLPNPRGSFGWGERFTRANVKDFGYGDLRDVLAGVDAALAAAPVDPQRVGVVGWSYGGFMAMWAPTQTGRFKAAVAGAGIANWQSYYGQNRIDRWMIPFFGAPVYDDPQVYARSSPITFIKGHKTPTLVLHGERDAEVPVPQGYEFWHALKTLGVPTRLVVYPDEGHRLEQSEHRRDVQKRTVDWLDQYLR